ncbi:MAG: hypothetical protein GVY07_15475 [Bacteroidetes bacterium]|nr:hypothetical protein [Bacteroidota bacterium]
MKNNLKKLAGETLSWQRPLPNGMYESDSRLTFDEQYFYGKDNRGAKYFAIDIQDGSIVWQKTNT